ncbi:MAG TPA: hypothetical protein VG456_22230 [Candidatus Sulfopaludibacter sp.]|jgi:hypothetical protein|nr:hypothetical protein [Candidatus Sulfopaludibacter sp.]
MKAKKALKRLVKAETLVAGVIDQYPAATDGLRELLDSARSSMSQARATIDVAPPARKAPAKAKDSSPNRLSEAGRKRISMAAKKRWAAERRRKTLRKTA